MTCASSGGYFEPGEQAPISFTQWKALLLKSIKDETTKRLSTTSDSHHRSTSRQYSPPTKKQDRQALPRNQVFDGTVVDSFLVSSTTNIAQSSIGFSRQDVPKLISSPTKRYVSSFKTLVNSTSGKHSQRLSYVNDSVIIVKLSKENATENTGGGGGSSQLSNKHSVVSIAASTTPITPPLKQVPSSSLRLSPIIKEVEGQERGTVNHDFCSESVVSSDLTIPSNSISNMAMSTTSHPSSNPSLFAYRSTVTGGSTLRQRALAESTTNSLLITTERLKSTNISSSMRPARQPLTTTTTMPSAYGSSQQPQRTVNQNIRSRMHQDKLNNSKDLYEYPDPFTNCPQDVLSKLAQLTKLQLETIDWEKKRRYTKKKPVTNGTLQGKDSP